MRVPQIRFGYYFENQKEADLHTILIAVLRASTINDSWEFTQMDRL
jgi:hypothetical protein